MELNDEQNGSSWNLVVFIGLLFILLPVSPVHVEQHTSGSFLDAG